MDFGFLMDKRHFQFGDYEIKPLPNIDDTLSEFFETAQVYDGWILPEFEQKQQGFPDKKSVQN
jgi:hypothetical protein